MPNLQNTLFTRSQMLRMQDLANKQRDQEAAYGQLAQGIRDLTNWRERDRAKEGQMAGQAGAMHYKSGGEIDTIAQQPYQDQSREAQLGYQQAKYAERDKMRDWDLEQQAKDPDRKLKELRIRAQRGDKTAQLEMQWRIARMKELGMMSRHAGTLGETQRSNKAGERLEGLDLGIKNRRQNTRQQQLGLAFQQNAEGTIKQFADSYQQQIDHLEAQRKAEMTATGDTDSATYKPLNDKITLLQIRKDSILGLIGMNAPWQEKLRLFNYRAGMDQGDVMGSGGVPASGAGDIDYGPPALAGSEYVQRGLPGLADRVANQEFQFLLKYRPDFHREKYRDHKMYTSPDSPYYIEPEVQETEEEAYVPPMASSVAREEELQRLAERALKMPWFRRSGGAL